MHPHVHALSHIVQHNGAISGSPIVFGPSATGPGLGSTGCPIRMVSHVSLNLTPATFLWIKEAMMLLDINPATGQKSLAISPLPKHLDILAD
ncbi:unnamed protein product [Protopolystoma xenopodis]|uniref:Uncharacterized protein n=1 Tax=Protopolystoma xenopodis TaxID=117903 RepID=A0A3S5C7J7_9PLAT|nr:unnamed protein product [Protopolystoma xenopodis]